MVETTLEHRSKVTFDLGVYASGLATTVRAHGGKLTMERWLDVKVPHDQWARGMPFHIDYQAMLRDALRGKKLGPLGYYQVDKLDRGIYWMPIQPCTRWTPSTTSPPCVCGSENSSGSPLSGSSDAEWSPPGRLRRVSVLYHSPLPATMPAPQGSTMPRVSLTAHLASWQAGMCRRDMRRR